MDAIEVTTDGYTLSDVKILCKASPKRETLNVNNGLLQTNQELLKWFLYQFHLSLKQGDHTRTFPASVVFSNVLNELELYTDGKK